MILRPLQRKQFTEQEHAVWRVLYAQQMERVQSSGKVHSMLMQGYEFAQLPADHCPDALEVSEKLYALNEWRLTDAKNPYLSDEDRYTPLHAKHFPATNYIRPMEDLAFTPLPDLAHDYFGHMPQIFHPILHQLQWKMADFYMRSNPEQKKLLYSFAWYVIEYSVVKEDGIPKIFGAGLLSSPGDFGRFLENTFDLIDADLEKICKSNRSPDKPHKSLFIFDSFAHMIQMIDEFEQLI